MRLRTFAQVEHRVWYFTGYRQGSQRALYRAPLYNHGTVIPQIANCTPVDFLQSTLAPLYLAKYWYVKEQLGNSIV